MSMGSWKIGSLAQWSDETQIVCTYLYGSFFTCDISSSLIDDGVAEIGSARMSSGKTRHTHLVLPGEVLREKIRGRPSV